MGDIEIRMDIEVPEETVRKWQTIVDMLAQIVKARAALITRARSSYIEVLLSSHSKDNPYQSGYRENLSNPSFCRTVIETKLPLLVPNAQTSQEYNSHTEISQGMISYLGHPLFWPGGELFGTICILDNKGNKYSSLFQGILLQFKEQIESHLNLLIHKQELSVALRESENRHIMENELRRSEERYSLAQRTANIGSWDWDILTGNLEWSEQIEPMFGFERGEFGSTYAAFLECIHPYDRKYVEESVRDAVEKDLAYDIEHRIIWPDGRMKWVSETGDVIRDDEGTAVRMIGIVQDITARKDIEEDLRRMALIVQDSNDAIAIQDREGHIITWNRGAERMYGYSEEEAIGMSMIHMVPQDSQWQARDCLERVLGGEAIESFETQRITRDGRTIDVWLTVTPLLNENGEVSAISTTERDITQRNIAERALRASESELSAIYHNAPITMLLVDTDRRIRKANVMTIETLDRNSEEIVGLRGGEALGCIHSMDDPKGCGFGEDCKQCIVRNSVMDTLTTGRTHHRVEATIHLNRGNNMEVLYLLVSTSTLDVGHGDHMVLVCLEDISDQKRTEEALRESEERYRLIVENTRDLVMLTKLDGTVSYLNPTAKELLGCIHNDDITQHLIGYSEDSAKVSNIFSGTTNRSIGSELEYRILARDGEIRWISHYWAPILRDGQPYMIMSVVRDIDEHKKVDQLKDEFIGLVSHELRTPMTVIMGAINTVLMEEENLSKEERQGLLQDALIESESLSHILGNLLELSRAQADRLILHPEMVNIEVVARATLDKVNVRYPAHQFIVDIPEELPVVYADEWKLERILHNLLDNAAKYSPDGGIVRVHVQYEDGHIVVGVRDQGIGLSIDDQARLFVPFERLEKTRGNSTKGIGLGLMVCQRLVEAHGGRIWVESTQGEGSLFQFTIPISVKE
ncbi:MAG: PAS domain S-box protein [Chloroflexota bacterium]|nr:PAS domain S-box protein [Chloroflexota bacterium]